MVFLLCWTLILLSDKAHYSRGVASPVQFEQTVNPSVVDSMVLQATAIQRRCSVCVFTETLCVSLPAQLVAPLFQYSKAGMDSLRATATAEGASAATLAPHLIALIFTKQNQDYNLICTSEFAHGTQKTVRSEETEGVCNASAVFGCFESTWAVICTIILCICT